MSDRTAVRRHRILIIVNPAAGRSRRASRSLDRIVAALERRGCTVALRRGGASSGGVERLAREAAADFDAIVAAGGDGTINAVANGVAAAPRTIALVPLGTANVLAHELGLPFDADVLAELIVSGPVRPVWPGRVGDRLFLTTAGAGFDAETVAAVNPQLKRHLGRAAFAWAILTRLIRCRRSELTVRVDGIDHPAAAVIATKGRFYAGPYVIAPAADPGEPTLDLLLFRRSGRLAVLRYLAALLAGRLARRADIVFLRAREATITATSQVPIQADGELLGAVPVTIGVAAQPLPLIRP